MIKKYNKRGLNKVCWFCKKNKPRYLISVIWSYNKVTLEVCRVWMNSTDLCLRLHFFTLSDLDFYFLKASGHFCNCKHCNIDKISRKHINIIYFYWTKSKGSRPSSSHTSLPPAAAVPPTLGRRRSRAGNSRRRYQKYATRVIFSLDVEERSRHGRAATLSRK